jgi:DHA2 family multidrug resistance protein-like MFS transporter
MATGVPAGVPHEAAEAARDNLGTAAAVARQLPEPLADPLLTAARAAFTSGFHVTALVSAALMVLVAALVLTLRTRQGGHAA